MIAAIRNRRRTGRPGVRLLLLMLALLLPALSLLTALPRPAWAQDWTEDEALPDTLLGTLIQGDQDEAYNLAGPPGLKYGRDHSGLFVLRPTFVKYHMGGRFPALRYAVRTEDGAKVDPPEGAIEVYHTTPEEPLRNENFTPSAGSYYVYELNSASMFPTHLDPQRTYKFYLLLVDKDDDDTKFEWEYLISPSAGVLTLRNMDDAVVRDRSGEGFTANLLFNWDLEIQGVPYIEYQVRDPDGVQVAPPTTGAFNQVQVSEMSGRFTNPTAMQHEWAWVYTFDYRGLGAPPDLTVPALNSNKTYTLRVRAPAPPPNTGEILGPWDAVVGPYRGHVGTIFTGTPPEYTYKHPIVDKAWKLMFSITVFLLVLILAWLGWNVIIQDHVGSPRAGWRELVPRVFLGLVAAASSLFWCALIIDLADALSAYVVANLGLQPADLARSALTPFRLILASASPGMLLAVVVVYVIYVFFVLVLLVQMLLRIALINILIALGPIAMGLWIVPHTSSWGKHWLRLFMTAVFQQTIQLLAVALSLGFLNEHATITATMSAGDVVWSLLLSVGFIYMATKVPTMLGHPGTFDSWLREIYFGMNVARGAVGAISSLGPRGLLAGAGMLGGGGLVPGLPGLGGFEGLSDVAGQAGGGAYAATQSTIGQGTMGVIASAGSNVMAAGGGVRPFRSESE